MQVDDCSDSDKSSSSSVSACTEDQELAKKASQKQERLKQSNLNQNNAEQKGLRPVPRRSTKNQQIGENSPLIKELSNNLVKMGNDACNLAAVAPHCQYVAQDQTGKRNEPISKQEDMIID